MIKNIRIVLIRTSHPGNIGASARAMKTMALQTLYLVKPKIFPSEQAVAMAAGAEDILADAVEVPELMLAIADCSLVIGTSTRSRSLSLPMLDPRQAAQMIVSEAQEHRVAILFGNERTGLEASELQQCHYHLQIPANAEYSSLNLAAAVQVVAYEILMARRQFELQHQVNKKVENLLATAEELNYFYIHLEQVLKQIQFIKTGHPNRIMQRLRRFFNRARPDKIEINILRGILSEVERSLSELKDL